MSSLLRDSDNETEETNGNDHSDEDSLNDLHVPKDTSKRKVICNSSEEDDTHEQNVADIHTVDEKLYNVMTWFSQDTIPYWIKLHCILEVVAAVWEVGIVDAALPHDKGVIRSYNFPEQNWKLPKHIMKDGKGQGTMYNKVNDTYRTYLTNHMAVYVARDATLSIVHFKEEWKNVAQFFCHFWFLHPEMSKQKAYQKARQLGAEKVKKKVHTKNEIRDLLASKRKQYWTKEIQMEFQHLEKHQTISHDDQTPSERVYYTFQQESGAVLKLHSFLGTFLKGSDIDVIKTSRNWWHTEASEEEKKDLYLLENIFSRQELHPINKKRKSNESQTSKPKGPIQNNSPSQIHTNKSAIDQSDKSENTTNTSLPSEIQQSNLTNAAEIIGIEITNDENALKHDKHPSTDSNTVNLHTVSTLKPGIHTATHSEGHPFNTDDAFLLTNVDDEHGNPEDILVTMGSFTCTRRSIWSLRKETCIANVVINCYTFHLCYQQRDAEGMIRMNEHCHCYPTQFYTTLIKHTNAAHLGQTCYNHYAEWRCTVPGLNIFYLSHLAIPIQKSQNHWACVLVSLKNQNISYYDPYNGSDPEALQLIMQYMKEEHKMLFQCELPKAKQFTLQDITPTNAPNLNSTNVHDAGVFLCAYIDHVFFHLPMPSTQEQIYSYRCKIAISLLKHHNHHSKP